jgi:hypothetical protein
MEIKINQGIPQHSFFAIAKPREIYDEPLVRGETIIKLVDPNTNEVTNAIYYGHWRMKENEFDIARGLAMLITGNSPKKLKPKLIEKYPQLKYEFIVDYWVLQKIN